MFYNSCASIDRCRFVEILLHECVINGLFVVKIVDTVFCLLGSAVHITQRAPHIFTSFGKVNIIQRFLHLRVDFYLPQHIIC